MLDIPGDLLSFHLQKYRRFGIQSSDTFREHSSYLVLTSGRLLELNTVMFTDIPWIQKHQPTKPQGISSQKTAILVEAILYSFIYNHVDGMFFCIITCMKLNAFIIVAISHSSTYLVHHYVTGSVI